MLTDNFFGGLSQHVQIRASLFSHSYTLRLKDVEWTNRTDGSRDWLEGLHIIYNYIYIWLWIKTY